ncbi:uncharacterized protein J3R85_001810 [Psidium guajava]|nr:uncharacterized protein J3R85_001810 [Psidium guajava]
MRIRKNAKLSSLLRYQDSTPEPPLPSHVCLLNQSPWDVLPFSFPDALPPSSSSLHQHLDGGEDSFTANCSSFGDSLGAVDSSVASMMAVDAEDKTVIVSKLEGRAYNRMNIEDRMNISSYEAKNGGDFSFKVCCNKTDGKRWQCKKDAVDGHYLCEHHLSQLKSYVTTTATAAADDDDDDDQDSNAANADDSASRKLDKSSSASTGRRGRPRGAKKNSSAAATAAAANSNQFYYYSGFGPSWGKRRSSGRAGDQQRRPEGRAAGGSPQQTAARIGGEGTDYIDYGMDDEEEEEEEEEDNDDGDSGKKRMRKPVKARSLKSLM